MTPRVYHRMAAWLEGFEGMTHARMASSIKPYENQEFSLAALRKAWLARAKFIAPMTAIREKRALEEFLGERLHAAMPREES